MLKREKLKREHNRKALERFKNTIFLKDGIVTK